jgi:hypothetical protein
MTVLQTQLLQRMALALLTAVTMTACGPSDKQRAAGAEEQRVQCLDKLCYGDVVPTFDSSKDAILKVNGQWYVGPKEYFTSFGPRGFNWWQHKALSTGSPRPPELEALIANGKGYDVSVEIFLTGRQRWPTPNVDKPWEGATWAREFNRIQAEGLRMQRKTITPQLDVVSFFHADGKAYDTTYYVATQQKSIRGGEPPVASCRTDIRNPNARCSSNEFWQPDVFADFRFRAKHAPDWPAIHQEIIRVLNLAKNVQP